MNAALSVVCPPLGSNTHANHYARCVSFRFIPVAGRGGAALLWRTPGQRICRSLLYRSQPQPPHTVACGVCARVALTYVCVCILIYVVLKRVKYNTTEKKTLHTKTFIRSWPMFAHACAGGEWGAAGWWVVKGAAWYCGGCWCYNEGGYSSLVTTVVHTEGHTVCVCVRSEISLFIRS